MNNYTNIYIVTPSYNSAQTIDRTISSVILQSGNFILNYHVQDGGSDDGTLEILEQWKKRIKMGLLPTLCKKIHFSYAGVKDKNMYDGICQGFDSFDMKPDDWMTWINSDDILMPGACAFISELDYQDLHQINWVTNGFISVDNDNLPTINCEREPLNQETVKNGLNDGVNLNFIQQEGTFFRNKLWQSINSKDLIKYKYAGDYNLWKIFAQHAKIYTANFSLGRFSRRNGQISDKFRDAYNNEIDEIINRKIRNQALLDLKDFLQLTLHTAWSSKKIWIKEINFEQLFKEKICKLQNTWEIKPLN